MITLENTVTKNNENNELVEKWKQQFKTIEKSLEDKRIRVYRLKAPQIIVRLEK